MAAIVTSIGTLFTGAMGWAGTVGSTIVAEGNELLLAFVVVPLVGLGVGLFHRLINIK